MEIRPINTTSYQEQEHNAKMEPSPKQLEKEQARIMEESENGSILKFR